MGEKRDGGGKKTNLIKILRGELHERISGNGEVFEHFQNLQSYSYSRNAPTNRINLIVKIISLLLVGGVRYQSAIELPR